VHDPGQRAFDDPAAGQDDEPDGVLRSADGLERQVQALVKGKETTPKTVAEGTLSDWDLSATPDGTVFLTGKATVSAAGSRV
jgi:hypothetical protein